MVKLVTKHQIDTKTPSRHGQNDVITVDKIFSCQQNEGHQVFHDNRIETIKDNDIPKDLEAKVEIDKLEELEAKLYGWFHHSKYLNKGLIKTFASSSMSVSISLWLR